MSVLELDASYGSYNTRNAGFSASTGLLGNRFAADFAFHTTGTDGYVHGTAGNSGSWYVALSWVGRDVVLRYRNIGNYEHTGQAWNGVTAGTGDLSIMDGTYGNNTGIKTYADMYAKGLGKFNSLYESLDTDTYGLSRYTLNDGSLWPKTTDNFWQDHNILIAGSFDVFAGKLIRIGHMGNNARTEKVKETLEALDITLSKLGFKAKASLAEEFSKNIRSVSKCKI